MPPYKRKNRGRRSEPDRPRTEEMIDQDESGNSTPRMESYSQWKRNNEFMIKSFFDEPTISAISDAETEIYYSNKHSIGEDIVTNSGRDKQEDSEWLV